MEYIDEYRNWCNKVSTESDLKCELCKIEKDENKIKEAFGQNISFGTGGLRGIMGVGTNRMNIYTIAKASQGLANFVKKKYPNTRCKIAISYDSRINSKLFADISACVFAANNIYVEFFPKLMPTPCLSFAVRKLGCIAGIMITASHNSAEYNGYKVYGKDGCQITTEAAAGIWNEIEKIDIFKEVYSIDFSRAIDNGSIHWISENIYHEYLDEVKKQSMLFGDDAEKNISIIYTPLNGTGLEPVTKILNDTGYRNVVTVKEQELPDGKFPTCKYPNPESKDAMSLGIKYMQLYNADILLATDPDCDRLGVAVNRNNGEIRILSGNEVGILLLDYICYQKKKNGTMPEKPVCMKSIVSTDMAECIANKYGVKIINVLTGFKYIGEQIGLLEENKETERFIFGFEESLGYLNGTYVRDKDGVNAAYLVTEMAGYYKKSGFTLIDKLNELYQKYGFYYNAQRSFEFKGIEGLTKMKNIMNEIRYSLNYIGKNKIINKDDFLLKHGNLPKSDVIKIELENKCSVIIRPSGTEPKLKIYICVCADDNKIVENTTNDIIKSFEIVLNNIEKESK